MAKTALHFEWINNAWVITTDSGEIVTGVNKVKYHPEPTAGNCCGQMDVIFTIDQATMRTVEN
jgi:hypothetical protein